MLQPNLADLDQYSDVVHTRRGEAVTVRFVTPDDAEALQAYVRGLSSRSRYNRFLGAMSELPRAVLEDFTHTGRDDRFSLMAIMEVGGVERVVAEARYAFHPEDHGVEFGLSVQDRWQGHGIGPALMQNVECRAAALGSKTMFGDTLRSNDVMITLAKKSGYLFRQHPDDWKLVRFEKRIAEAAPVPCASLRLVSAAEPLGEMPAH
ncbi:GNAT family N-acetyltransferase [Bradyrhizobium sp. STM 3557]|uniref:GNAT family N-acetyltransferase n=1 Tax=Bradyrhizobium sp. STM 3557 TaxID=578920 RepID=UPI00388FB6AA